MHSFWRSLKWVLLVTVPRTVLDATASVLTRLGNAAAQLVLRTQPRRAALRTASVRQDHRKYCVLVLRTHPVGAVVLKSIYKEMVMVFRMTKLDVKSCAFSR